jgi:hypothetical protein
MTAPVAPLIDSILCRRCGNSLVADVKGVAWEVAVTRQPCPCQTRDHAHRIRTEAAQRAEDADRYARGGRRRARPRT